MVQKSEYNEVCGKPVSQVSKIFMFFRNKRIKKSKKFRDPFLFRPLLWEIKKTRLLQIRGCQRPRSNIKILQFIINVLNHQILWDPVGILK